MDGQTDSRTLDSFVDPATHSLLREQSGAELSMGRFCVTQPNPTHGQLWSGEIAASVFASNVSWCKFYETRDTVCMFVVLLR